MLLENLIPDEIRNRYRTIKDFDEAIDEIIHVFNLFKNKPYSFKVPLGIIASINYIINDMLDLYTCQSYVSLYAYIDKKIEEFFIKFMEKNKNG